MIIDLNFEPTSKCNLNCLYCGREQLILNGIRDAGDMPYDLLENIVEQYSEIAKEHPGDRIKLAPVGLGEPLLYPRFFDAIKLIREKFGKCHIHINTNGILLNQDNIDKIYESEINRITVSINTWGYEDYIKIHKAPYFNIVKNNIEKLLSSKPKGDERGISIQLLNIEFNKIKNKDFRKYWKSLGANATPFRPFTPRHNYFQKLMPIEDQIKFKKYFGKDEINRFRTRYPCPVLFPSWRYSIMINKDGYIFPCCHGVWCKSNSDICFGNVRDGSIKDLYNENLPNLRYLHENRKWDELEECSRCNAWISMK